MSPADLPNRLRVGLVYETQADAEREMEHQRKHDLSLFYHWREPFELAAVQAAIEALGHQVIRIGTPQSMVGDLARWRRDVDFIFNMSVGFTDRFRLAAAPMLFELAGLPYSGANPFTKMVSQNKDLLKSQFELLGLPTPAYVVAAVGEVPTPAALPPFPCIVKPVAEGSSVGVWPESVVFSFDELKVALERVWRVVAMDALIESFVEGREIKVVLLGDLDYAWQGIIEDVDGDGQSLGDRILHFDAKSIGAMGKRAIAPSAAGMDRVLEDCWRMYRRFAPVDYASFDLRINPEGQHYFLEFQADATLHPERTLARCCELNGLSYDAAIQFILTSAITRQRPGVGSDTPATDNDPDR